MKQEDRTPECLGLSATASLASGPRLEDERVIAAMHEYLAALEAGQKPDRADFLARHPAIAEELADCLEGLDFVHGVGPQLSYPVDPACRAGLSVACSAPDLPAEAPLGDYRIVREIGHGGMGVVYEAVQVSLGRRVALKVLPFAAALDTRQLQRFKNEAQAVAQLHHTNIVPVFGVGTDRGIHYYAMQLIEGKTLSALIEELRQHMERGAPSAERGEPGAAPVADTSQVQAGFDSTVRSALGAPRSAPFFRTVATLGIQAAVALEHAHQMGVIHRDIKPANLLIDLAPQPATLRLWITDFGLAHCQSQAGLTMTGDLVGTLRYMSPEQALAQRVLVDERTDIYSLGVTLYELLTLQPAYSGRDRQELLRQIAFDEPRPPRRLNKAMPPELETIVLKAMEKNPADRYATAQELADDLQRFLEDKPIRARRPALAQRVRKWGRRHKAVVATLTAAVAVLLVVAALGSALAAWHIAAARDDEKRERQRVEKQRDEIHALNKQLQRLLYIADMNRAQHAWHAADVGRVQELLGQHRPKPGEPDLRGFEWHYLDQLCNSQLLTFKGNRSGFNRVAFSPDGKCLAAACWNDRDQRAIKIWDAGSGQEIRTLYLGPVQPGHLCDVVFSPDGTRLASPASDGTVKIWDARTGRETLILTLKGDTESIGGLGFSPDGKHLAVACTNRIDVLNIATEVRVLEAQTGREILTFKGHEDGGEVRGVAFSPDGKRVASADLGTVKVWHAQTGGALLTLTGWHNAPGISGFYKVDFSPDGKRLAGAGDQTIIVWDVQTGKKILILHGHTRQVLALAFSPDGTRLASASLDRTVKVWDVRTGRPAGGETSYTIKGHSDAVSGVAFSPDGKRLASASADGTVKLWDARNGQQPLSLIGLSPGVTSELKRVAFSPDGARLASVSWDGTVKLWDAQSFQETLTLGPGTDGVASLAFSPDSGLIASGSHGGTVRVWNAKTGRDIFRALKKPLRGSIEVAFSPDGKCLATGSADGALKLHDAQTGREILALAGHTKAIGGVAFSPDGRFLASASSDNMVKIWDVRDGRRIVTLKHSRQVTGVAFSPDGRRLGTASSDKSVRLWDAHTGEQIRTLKGHVGDVSRVAFGPNGERLASASSDGTLKVWDAETGQEILTLEGGYDDAFSGIPGFHDVAFSPDGRHLATAGTDGNVRVWGRLAARINPNGAGP